MLVILFIFNHNLDSKQVTDRQSVYGIVTSIDLAQFLTSSESARTAKE